MTELYGADEYIITEMKAIAIIQVINRSVATQCIMSLGGDGQF